MPETYEQLAHAADELEDRLVGLDFRELADDVRRGDEDALYVLNELGGYLRQAYVALDQNVRTRRTVPHGV